MHSKNQKKPTNQFSDFALQTDGWMDGRTDGHKQSHWTLPLVWASKNQTLKTNFYAVSRHALNPN